MKQKGLCAICGLKMGKNISYDQIIAGKGYLEENVQLAHDECNTGKGEWDFNVLLDVAKYVYDQEHES